MSLFGADYKRETIIELLETKPVELAGTIAANMGHGIVVHHNGALFVATEAEALKRLEAETNNTTQEDEEDTTNA